jgi:hypothetical protein
MTTALTTDECLHGLEQFTCSLCRKAAGYRPGSDRHANDCTVVALANLTGADYAEALEMMAEAGRRNGCGAYAGQVHDALTAAGWTVTASTLTIDQAVRSGRNFHVTARKGKRGHSWAIVAGTHLNGWRDGYRYRLYEVA